MNWFVYLFKTPWVQKKQDWAEYKNLKQEIMYAIIYLYNKTKELEHVFLEEERYEEYDSCLKKRLMTARSKPAKGAEFECSLMYFQPSRCENFAPVGNEQPCTCTGCGAYPNNRGYFAAKQELNNLTMKYKHFWKNKFNHNVK